MSEKLKLFGTRLLIKEDFVEKKDLEKTASGLFIPRSNNPSDRLYRGVVIGVGDEAKKVKVGDTVVYDKMGPAPFKVNGEVFEMLDESAIIGVYA